MPDREHGTTDYQDEDDKKLEAMGYVPSFKREFSNLATVCAPTLLSDRVSYGCGLLDQLRLQHYGVYYVMFFKLCPLTSARRDCAHLSRPHSTRRYSWEVLHLYGAITPSIYV